MDTCKTCKYWSRHKARLIGECDKVDIDETAPNDPTLFSINVSCDDDSGMNIVLQTGENFGCNQYQPKQ